MWHNVGTQVSYKKNECRYLDRKLTSGKVKLEVKPKKNETIARDEQPCPSFPKFLRFPSFHTPPTGRYKQMTSMRI